MRPSHPRRLELGAESYDQQHGKGFNPVHGPAERLQARGVGPMRILEDHQHRLLSATVPPLVSERFQRFLPAPLRGQFERWIASIVRQRQHLGKECGVLREVEVCASRASSLSSFTCAVSSCASPAARSIWPMIG